MKVSLKVIQSTFMLLSDTSSEAKYSSEFKSLTFRL